MTLTLEQQQRNEDLAWLMQNAAGRRILRWIIWDLAGFHHLVVTPEVLRIKDGTAEGMHAFHTDGKRYVGSALYQALQGVDLSLRRQLLDEAFTEAGVEQATNTPWATESEDDRA